jgi:hypothetical protein
MHEASAPQISTLLNLLQQYQAAPPPRMVLPPTVPSTPTRAGTGGGENDAGEGQLTPRYACMYVCMIFWRDAADAQITPRYVSMHSAYV